MITQKSLSSLSLLPQPLKESIEYLEKSISTKDHSYVYRVVKRINHVRRNIHNENIDIEQNIFSALPPEIYIYLSLHKLLQLLDHQQIEQCLQYSSNLIEIIKPFNKRSLDPLTAKCFYYYYLVHKKAGCQKNVRPALLSIFQTCSLRHDMIGISTLSNLILDNYLSYNLYHEANQFRLHTQFPSDAPNNQHARYLFYIAKINVVMLDYQEALNNVLQSIRKAPQHMGLGFRQIAYKLWIIVQLLLGDIPERSIFNISDLKFSLQPYFNIVKSVYIGDLDSFNQIVKQYYDNFIKDNTITLINRLRLTVIKTGNSYLNSWIDEQIRLKKIIFSYSRLSLKDVAQRLGLITSDQSETLNHNYNAAAENICRKAIYDGIIEAYIDHETSSLVSRRHVDAYSTFEPFEAFSKRINFCLSLHDEAIKSMKFPSSNEYIIETEEDKQEREREEEVIISAQDEHDYDYY